MEAGLLNDLLFYIIMNGRRGHGRREGIGGKVMREKKGEGMVGKTEEGRKRRKWEERGLKE